MVLGYLAVLILIFIAYSVILVKQEKSFTLDDIQRELQAVYTDNSSNLCQTNEAPESDQTLDPSVLFIPLQNRTDLGITYPQNANLINTQGSYAILSANMLQPKHTLSYSFNLPFTCLAWISIGYGCFIIIPYQEQTLSNTTNQANHLLWNTMLNWNDKMKSKVIIMSIKVDKGADFPQANLYTHPDVIFVSQMSRIFISKLITYTIPENNKKDVLKDSYFITSDADLFPLSAKSYHERSFDWNLLAVAEIVEHMDKLYIALSCVGATFKTWNTLIQESNYTDVEYFNATGMMQVKKVEREFFIIKKARKIDWYLDQKVLSKYIFNYAKNYGWDKLSTRKYRRPDVTRRVDRKAFEKDYWDEKMDEMYFHRFKDAHICRNTWENKCWFRVYQLLGKILDEKQLQNLAVYRSKMLNVVLKNPEIGDFRENKRIHIENGIRAKYLAGGLDVRLEWSFVYPRVFKEGSRPKFVDWDSERLFMDAGKNAKFKYYVIPKLNSSHFYAEARPIFCSDCKEIIFV